MVLDHLVQCIDRTKIEHEIPNQGGRKGHRKMYASGLTYILALLCGKKIHLLKKCHKEQVINNE